MHGAGRGVLQHNVMVRAVHGHSGRIGTKIKNDLAFTRVREVECLNHYTKMKFLRAIIGSEGQGLVPGGTLRKSDRTHIYCVPRRPPLDGAQPNEDCRHGTDCIVTLDHVRVAEHNAMFRTGKGAILIHDPVPIADILRVSLVGVAGYTLWKRPEPLTPPQRCVRCNICRREYVNGTIWCYDGCWMPLTWLSVQERIVHIARVADRVIELEVCYGLTFKTLQPMLCPLYTSPSPRDP